jgi:hypothetical protein
MSTTINGSALSTFGITSVKASHQNLADGRMVLECAGKNADAAFEFDYLDRVVLRVDGTVRWAGPCVRRLVTGMPGQERHVYEIASPWWYLAQQTYLQPWSFEAGDVTAYSARCILGMATDGTTRQTIATVAGNLLTWANDCGWPVTSGTFTGLGIDFPIEEVKGLKVMEVLRLLLRWTPDAVAWWTFGTESTDDALNIKRRASLSAASLTVGTAPLEGVPQITPREDLKPGSVIIQYERTDVIDDVPVTSTAFDRYPALSDGTEAAAAIFTIDLQGGSRSYLKQVVRTVALPLTFTGGGLADARKFWGRKMGLIGKAEEVASDPDDPDILFLTFDSVYYKRTLASPDGIDGSGPYEYEDPANTGSTKVRVATGLDRELIDGVVTPWMSGISAQEQHFEFSISYKLAGESAYSVPEKVTVTITATDAITREYTEVDSLVTGEEPTTGLAQALYEAMTVDHYEGQVQLVATDVPTTAGLGTVLNISSGRSEWASMNAVVQAVDEDFDAGRRTLTLGAPEHLGPQDAIELQRVNRRPEGVTGNRAANTAMRRDGTP